jgi:hypothetical protein
MRPETRKRETKVGMEKWKYPGAGENVRWVAAAEGHRRHDILAAQRRQMV